MIVIIFLELLLLTKLKNFRVVEAKIPLGHNPTLQFNLHLKLDFVQLSWSNYFCTKSGLMAFNVKPIDFISSETDEVRAKREPSLCNESVKRHFWSNLAKSCTSKVRDAATRRGSSEARTEFRPHSEVATLS